MRFAVLLLIACGGSPKQAPPVANEAPAAPPPMIATSVPAPPPPDDQTRGPAMTGDPCEGGQVAPASEGDMSNKPPKKSVPTVQIGQATVGPALDKEIIRRYIKRNIQKIQYCYEKALLAKPGLSGKIMASFVIGLEGHVDSSKATGFDPEVAECIATVIKDIEFPKPRGGTVQVNYPFVFDSAGN